MPRVTPESTSVELRIYLIAAQWKLFDSGEWIYGLDSLIAFVEKDRKWGKLCLRIPGRDLITEFYCMDEGRRKVLIKIIQFLCTAYYTFFLSILRIYFFADKKNEQLLKCFDFLFVSDRLIQEENFFFFPNKASCLKEFSSPYVF